MNFGYFTLFIAIVISCVAEFYSIAGLVAIFSASPLPVIIMGVALGIGKLTATVWLKLNWDRASLAYKLYLVPAVGLLMFLTSIGCFGFLSKAHSDQSLVSGDVQAKIAVYDEKIRTARENIDANRKALKQMDEAVDQVMGRSTTETGADKAVAIRRTQQKERVRLQSEIAAEQKTIAALNEEAAPIRAEVRKVEAEVGPIKYIAALVYGDNTDANILESAVRWVIILIVIVLDPLALVLLLAGQQSLKWEKQRLFEMLKLPDPEPNWQQRTDELPDIFKDQPTDLDPEPEPEKSLLEQHPYLTAGFPHFKDLQPMVYKPNAKFEVYAGNPNDFKEPWSEEDKQRLSEVMTKFFDRNQEQDDNIDEDEHPSIKAAMAQWKLQNPKDTLKNQRAMLARGEISELPWMALVQHELPPETSSGFGSAFPADPVKGDSFVRIDSLPNRVYKFNGNRWIEVDKTQTDNYTYNEAYLDHLIAKIDSGEYDVDLLSTNEQDQITQRLQKKAT